MSALAERASHGGDRSARIGPNAVTRLAEALRMLCGEVQTQAIFADAGALHHLLRPPEKMVPDDDVATLHKVLHEHLGHERAVRVGAEAGRLTGLYLLANRIPPLAQSILRRMPRRLALRVLMRAIGGHAWTFAGAGRFDWRMSPAGATLSIAGGPVSRYIVADGPACAYYAATFTTIFAAIIDRNVRVEEVACEASGASACVFEVALSR
jgi:divinyl protochlorophyllide a 8-vinyl-reductase